jgi:hypothetical protein
MHKPLFFHRLQTAQTKKETQVKHENTHKQHKQVTYYLSMRPKQ